MPIDAQTKALLKKECYQSAVRVADLVSEDSNLASLHDMSRDLSQVIYDAVLTHLKIEN
jgi:hypothetical protein